MTSYTVASVGGSRQEFTTHRALHHELCRRSHMIENTRTAPERASVRALAAGIEEGL